MYTDVGTTLARRPRPVDRWGVNRPLDLPDNIAGRPFSRSEARDVGLTSRSLDGYRFVRLFPEVYGLRSLVLSQVQWIDAAVLAVPAEAFLSHVTRIQRLDIGIGRPTPFHFTIGKDLHLDIPRIMLHRTKVLPSRDGTSLGVEAAFVGAGCNVNVLQLIMIGDWLLRDGHTSIDALAREVIASRRRPGAAKARRALGFLRTGAESAKESETRAIICAAALPEPELNVKLHDAAGFIGRVDMLFPDWRVIVEYEGRQHADSLHQWNKDLWRYERLERAGYVVIRVTQEMLRRPRELICRIHAILVERCFVGSAPTFGPLWRSLFA